MKINDSINMKYKRGDKHPSKDLLFWTYCKTCKNGEYWVSKSQYNKNKKDRRASSKRGDNVFRKLLDSAKLREKRK